MSGDQERDSLAAHFDRHADEEGRIVEAYRALAGKLADSAAGMLVDRILTDEEIHHLLLRTMATWLRERTGARAVPRDADRGELLHRTQALHRHERETVAGCRSLRTRLSGRDRDLLGTLLEAMALDSEKHERLLGAVEKMLRE